MSDIVSIDYATVEEFAALLLKQSEGTLILQPADPVVDSISNIPANINAHAAFADDRRQQELLTDRGIKESENLTKVKDTIKMADEDLANS